MKCRVEVDRRVCQDFGAGEEPCSTPFYLSAEDGKSKIGGAGEIEEGGENVKDIVESLGFYGLAEDAYSFKAIKVERP